MIDVTRIDIPTMQIALLASTHTQASVSFEVISLSSSLGARAGVGWVDVHHPCIEHVRLFVRAVLPERLLNPEAISQLVMEIKSKLEIPPDETFEVDACSAKSRMGVSHSVDRKGNPGRIETTRRFKSPA
jgi:hypothetical protein